MATLTSRLCSKAGCRGIVRNSVCSVCGPVIRRSGWRNTTAGTRQQRGYDDAWLRVRKLVIERELVRIAEHCELPYIICQLCNEPIYSKREMHVDHIKPFNGIDDPLRLDVSNLRVVHARCHMRRTAEQRKLATLKAKSGAHG